MRKRWVVARRVARVGEVIRAVVVRTGEVVQEMMLEK